MTTRTRHARLTPRFWISLAVIVAILGLLAAGIVLARTGAYTPQAAVRQYFAALTARDTERILELERDLDQDSYAIKAVQSREYQPPQDVRIGLITEHGADDRWVEITYTINSQPFTSTVTVVRNSKRSIPGPRTWHTTGVLGGLQFESAFFAMPKINGRLIPQNSDVVPPLLPGGYRVTNASNPLADIPAARVAVPVGGVGSADLAPKLKPDAAAAMDPLVTRYVDRCIASAAGGTPNDDCTFLKSAGIHGGEKIKLDAYPAIDLELSEAGITVSTTTSGRLTVSSEPSGKDQHVRFSVAGFAYMDTNNTPFFSPKI